MKILCGRCGKEVPSMEDLVDDTGDPDASMICPDCAAAESGSDAKRDWRPLPATEKQRAYLQQTGSLLADSPDLTRGEASDAIDSYARVTPASSAQLGLIRQLYEERGIHQFPPEGLTVAAASRLIDSLMEKG